MLQILNNLPKDGYVALSGGCDSAAVLDFLSKTRKLSAAFFHHGTETSDKALYFVEEFCRARSIELKIGSIESCRNKRESAEDYWRRERYKFLHSLSKEVITGHNLDDVVETWIFTNCHGEAKLIPYRNKNVVRPFLLTKKQHLKEWCIKNDVPWIEDDTNKDIRHPRNRIRHNMMNDILQINPGIHKVIKRKIIEREKLLDFQT